MTLPVSPNSISLSQIATEFSGNASLNSGDYPLELGEYYGQDAAPTTGAISFSNFHGGDGVPTSGLQYHYDGQISETTGVAGGVEDISVNDRTGTLTNGAAYSSANLGKVVFDGTNDYVQVTGYKGVTGTSARTSIIFVKLDAATPAAQARAFSWGGVGGNGQKWSMEFTTAGNFQLNGSGGSKQTTSTFVLSGWQMFSATIPTGVTGTNGVGQSGYTTAGSNSFTVPAGVYSISAVCIGGGGGGSGNDGDSDESGGGGGGGALAYQTSIPVNPGEVLTVVVGAAGAAGGEGGTGGAGGTSSISRGVTVLVAANGGGGGRYRAGGGGAGGTVATGTGGAGGAGGVGNNRTRDPAPGGGGGGAGGYSGAGGAGGSAAANNTGVAGAAGAGGGGGGGGSGLSNTARGGGGVGILGAGANGAAGAANASGGGGSGGATGTFAGGAYGGGGAGRSGDSDGNGGAGSVGAVRIIWGPSRSYPSTSVANATVVTGTNTIGFLSDITLYSNATRLTGYAAFSPGFGIVVNTASSADVSWGASLADSVAGPIDGEIAKVLIYNRELSHAEITQIYNAKAVALGLTQLSATTL
jgi:hypothetical protein